MKLKRGQKRCKKCQAINAARQRICIECKHEFTLKNTPINGVLFKVDKKIDIINFDELLKEKVNKENPIIFDVGGHNGGSIKKFKLGRSLVSQEPAGVSL